MNEEADAWCWGGWMDGWTTGWKDGWMDGWMDEYEWMGRQMDGRVDMNGWVDR